ncbi:hypothetical protein [Saccharopolyspora shandongensis]|uniref:hypothetical protein n=1 Tax=Saccharopolyspora shandongensis TaxID=418495 RepID=UPI0033E3BA2D
MYPVTRRVAGNPRQRLPSPKINVTVQVALPDQDQRTGALREAVRCKGEFGNAKAHGHVAAASESMMDFIASSPGHRARFISNAMAGWDE